MNDHIISLIVAVLTGLAACIPLVVKLVQYIQLAVKEKNWQALLGLVIDLMQQAEGKFADGATRKEWVMAMVKTSAEYLNYQLDSEALSNLIDALCDMSNVLNADKLPAPPETEGDSK